MTGGVMAVKMILLPPGQKETEVLTQVLREVDVMCQLTHTSSNAPA